MPCRDSNGWCTYGYMTECDCQSSLFSNCTDWHLPGDDLGDLDHKLSSIYLDMQTGEERKKKGYETDEERKKRAYEKVMRQLLVEVIAEVNGAAPRTKEERKAWEKKANDNIKRHLAALIAKAERQRSGRPG